MFSIEALYTDKKFNDLLKMLARKKSLTEDFEDLRQEVFVELCEYECQSRKAADGIAQRVTQRLYRERLKGIDENGDARRYSYDENRDYWRGDIDGKCRSVLWEDNHIV